MAAGSGSAGAAGTPTAIFCDSQSKAYEVLST
jgi:hypothetical protein